MGACFGQLNNSTRLFILLRADKWKFVVLKRNCVMEDVKKYMMLVILIIQFNLDLEVLSPLSAFYSSLSRSQGKECESRWTE